MKDKRDIRSIAPIDLKLTLLAGESLIVDNLEVKQLKLREINEIGYERYKQLVSIIAVGKEELCETINYLDDIDEKTVFDIIFDSDNLGLISEFIHALKFFLKEDEVIYHEKFGLVFGNVEDRKMLNSLNFNYLVDAVKYTNCLYSVDKDQMYNPENEKAMSIIKKLKRGRDIVDKIKSAKSQQEGKDDIDFADIVSAVSTNGSSYNKHNIWDATIYQVYDEFRGLDKFVSYKTNILAMINGAKVDIKHWASKSE